MKSSLNAQYEWMQRNSAWASATLLPVALLSNYWFASSLLFALLSVLGRVGSYLHWRSIHLDREGSFVAFLLAIGAPVLASNIYDSRAFLVTLLTCFSLYLFALFALLFISRTASFRESVARDDSSSRPR